MKKLNLKKLSVSTIKNIVNDIGYSTEDRREFLQDKQAIEQYIADIEPDLELMLMTQIDLIELDLNTVQDAVEYVAPQCKIIKELAVYAETLKEIEDDTE